MTTKTRKTKASPRPAVKRTAVNGTVLNPNTKVRKSTAGKSAAEATARINMIVRRKRRSRNVSVVGTRGLKGQGLIQVGRVKKLELRERLGMPRPLFGRIVNVAERTIAKVESGAETPDKLKRPYNEVYRLWEALSDLVDPNSLGQWFNTPNESFDGLKPIEVIERGEIDRLWNMVFELQTGMPG